LATVLSDRPSGAGLAGVAAAAAGGRVSVRQTPDDHWCWRWARAETILLAVAAAVADEARTSVISRQTAGCS